MFRLLVQITFFIILPGLYVNAFAGIKQIYIGVIKQSFNFVDAFPQLIGALAIIPVTILLGRYFCGWMCAFGTLSDIIYHISSRVLRASIRINEKTDKVLKTLKFILLGFIIFTVWSFDIVNFSTANPWNVFGILVSFGKVPDISYAFSEFTVGFIIVLAIIGASFFIERFFCRYLCPLGAVFVILSKLKFIRINKPAEKCGACTLCTKSCAMGISLNKYDEINSGECINCLKCIPACPRKNVSVSLAGDNTRPIVVGVLAVLVMTCIYCTGSLVTNIAGIDTSNNLTVLNSVEGINNGLYADGTYQGSGIGFRRRVTTVSVTVEKGTITNIELISHGDDAKWFNRSYNSVVNQILSTQSADVDAVSGATYSSNGIMDAVANALSKAKV